MKTSKLPNFQTSKLPNFQTVKLLFLLAFSFLIAKTSNSQSFEEVFLESASNKGTQELFYRNSQVSAGGYVYVAGASLNNNGYYDILLTKYSGTTELWSVDWDGTANGNDYATDVTVDNSGNLIVVGTTSSTGTTYDGVILKYNSSGTLIWDEVFDSGSSLMDGFAAVAVDASNNIYACGGAMTTTEQSNFLTVKYNSSGTYQWSSFYDYNNLQEVAVKIALSGSNLRVTGVSQNNSTDWSVATLSYSMSTGVQQQERRVSGTNNGLDEVSDIAVQGDYTYVASSVLNTNGYDWNILKLNADLSVNWSVSYNNAANLDDKAKSLKVDANGLVYVTGFETTSTEDKNMLTRVYNANGTLKWSKDYDAFGNEDRGLSLELDNDGHVVVSGASEKLGNLDYYTTKYDKLNGDKFWGIRYNSVHNGDDIPNNIAISEEGVVYVIGTTGITDTTTTYTMCKYVEHEIYNIPDDEDLDVNQKFVANNGQLLNSDTLPDPTVKFYNTLDYPRTYFHNDKISFVLSKMDTNSVDSVQRIDMRYNKNNTTMKTLSHEELDSYYSYYLGHIPEGRERVKHLKSLFVPEIYDDIDAVLTNKSNGFKMYYVCKPGFSPLDAEFEFTGHTSLSVSSNKLTVSGDFDSFEWDSPEAYQIAANGTRIDMGWTPSYSISGNTVSLTLGSYNSSLPLIIEIDKGSTVTPPDPDENLEWSSYIMEMSNSQSFIEDVAVDEADDNSVYFVGQVMGSLFPAITGDTYSALNIGDLDVVTFKLDENLYLQWGTFYGGSIGQLYDEEFSFPKDFGRAITVDPITHHCYILGDTQSSNFPVEYGGAYEDDNAEFQDQELDPPVDGRDAFIVNFDANGQRIWATCYGDNDADEVFNDGVVIGGSIYGVGRGTILTPLENELYSTGEGLIVKYSLTGQREMASLFPVEVINGIDKDSQDNYFITGNHKAAGAFVILNEDDTFDDSDFQGSSTTRSGFLSKFSDDDVLLMSESFYCGNDIQGRSLVVDNSDDVVVVGFQEKIGGNFPFVQSLDHVQGTGYFEADPSPLNTTTVSPEGYVIKTDNDGVVLWSTYFGSTWHDWILAVTVDSEDNICFGGYTYSGFETNPDIPFPATNPDNTWIQSDNLSLGEGSGEGFLSMMDEDGDIVWTTYYGGRDREVVLNLETTSDDKLYGCGWTNTINSQIDEFNENLFPMIDNAEDINLDWYQDNTFPENENAGFTGFGFRFDLFSVQNPISVQELSSENKFSIYPNPCNDEFIINMSLLISSDKEVTIFNSQGELIQRFTPRSAIITYDSSKLSPGMYVVCVQTEKDKFSQRIVVN